MLEIAKTQNKRFLLIQDWLTPKLWKITLVKYFTILLHVCFQSKKAFEKSGKEANEAFQNYQKADRDMNMTKLQIEKVHIPP